MLITINLVGLFKTILLFTAPFLFPRLIRLILSYFQPKPINVNPQAPSAPPHQSPPPTIPNYSPKIQLCRTCLLSLTCSYLFVKAIKPTDNLFLLLSPPKNWIQGLVPSLRQGLDIRVSNTVLERLLMLQKKKDVLDEQDLTLLSRFTSLESRHLYLSYGPLPLLYCNWCSTTSPLDYLVNALPGIALKYITIAAICSVLLSGAQGRRKKWRAYVVGCLMVVGVGETAGRWQNSESNLGQAVMLDTYLSHLLPSLLFIPLLLLSYSLPSSPLHPSTRTLLLPPLQALLKISKDALEELRKGHLNYMGLMSDSKYREVVKGFGEVQGREMGWAKGDRVVKELRRVLEMKSGEGEGEGVGEGEGGYRIGEGDKEEIRRLFGMERERKGKKEEVVVEGVKEEE